MIDQIHRILISIVLFLTLEIDKVLLDFFSESFAGVNDLFNNISITFMLLFLHFSENLIPLVLDCLANLRLELVDTGVHEILRVVQVNNEWILFNKEL